MRRSCVVSDSECLAPAGLFCGGGWAEGSGSCRGTCTECGEAVCRKCSRIVRGVRICHNCQPAEVAPG